MTSPGAPVTIVTGSSRGIGRAIADALAADGHRLLLVARTARQLSERAAALRARGAVVETCAVDLRVAGAVDEVLSASARHFGPPDVVVSNAGTAPSAKIEDTTDAALQEVWDLHVAAPLAFARACAPGMKARGAGALVHLASTAGLRGYPFTSAYTAAKHAMVGLTRALHEEMRDKGLRCYAVCPGFVDSDITRQAADAVASKGRTTAADALTQMGRQNRIGRMHTCEEVAAAVAALLRDRPDGCVYHLDQEPPGFLD
ncbi:MAG: SDR family NAD(P)-dependent oxidoreductase [Planctomycetota bacterium]